MQILIELFKHKVNTKLKNSDRWNAMEIAVSNNDLESIIIIYEYILKRREKKILHNKERAIQFLSTIPDFYLEMTWEVQVPLLGFMCPSDKCKIWKIGPNVRMDYTFTGFKDLKSIRCPSSYIFNGSAGSGTIFQYDLKQNVYHDPFEPLEDDEKELIIRDILGNNRINGEFKLKQCEIAESHGLWSKKPVLEKINGWASQKYEVNITAMTNIHNKTKYEYLNMDKETYWNAAQELERTILNQMNDQEVKSQLADGFKVKNNKIRDQLMKIGNNKDKKLKAYVWIAENFPIKASVNFNFDE